MKKRLKECVDCGRMRPIWSKGRCKQCDAIFKGYTIRKRKKKKKGEKTQVDVFKEIWEERKHKSQLSGKPLGPDMKACYFAHINPKGSFPELKTAKWNIVLLTCKEHTLLDHDTEENRQKYAEENNCDWSFIYKLKKSK